MFAVLLYAARSTYAQEWWYINHFPAVYSSESEWCVIQNNTESIWFYNFSESSWSSPEEYEFENNWWYVDRYPYIYSLTNGWFYCYSTTNSLELINISSGESSEFSGSNSEESNAEEPNNEQNNSNENETNVPQTVALHTWNILNATQGAAINLSLLDAYEISGALPDFTVTLSHSIPGIEQSGSNLVGTPTESGVVDITVTAQLNNDSTLSNTTQLVVAANDSDLPEPTLPTILIDYEAIIASLPDQYTSRVDEFGNIANTDNTPNDNPVTNAGATLGRVLFYDKRLSLNNAISCASCHQQDIGFSDDRQFSLGFAGGETGRASTSLSHARYYDRGRFFWDERAETLEDQVLMPIQDSIEMGMTLDDLRDKLAATSFYPDLFEDAFGDSTITDERIANAMAQFIRAMVSTESKFDQAFVDGELDTGAFTDQELEGLQLFSGNAGTGGRDLGCIRCHETIGFVGDNTHNIGLDLVDTDEGAGNGEFKVQSLRNIAVSAPYMHDGRFATLREVIDHYDSGVQDNPNLSNRLRRRNNDSVRRLNLSEDEKNSLEAFLNTLTDEAFLSDERFSDPFVD